MSQSSLLKNIPDILGINTENLTPSEALKRIEFTEQNKEIYNFYDSLLPNDAVKNRSRKYFLELAETSYKIIQFKDRIISNKKLLYNDEGYLQRSHSLALSNVKYDICIKYVNKVLSNQSIHEIILIELNVETHLTRALRRHPSTNQSTLK